jgi:hypothetical protein
MEDKLINYWTCTIGPIYRKFIPDGGDSPLRQAVQNKFYDMFGLYADFCSSGWGLTEEMNTRLRTISLLPITDKTNATLKGIDSLLALHDLIQKDNESRNI